MWRCVALFIICCVGSAHADQASDGKALLERNCGRCHAVAPGAESPRKEAPNLSIVLESYPAERLQSELTEGNSPEAPRDAAGSLLAERNCQYLLLPPRQSV
jgi:mono/diheme cytochrome c family protein